MADWAPRRGGTLLIVSGPNHDPSRKHLFVICTNPNTEGKVLLVSVCSRYDGCDETCLLGPKAHAFLNRPSYILYQSAWTASARFLQESAANQSMMPREDFRPSILEEICAGFAKSDETPPECRLFYEKYKTVSSGG